MFRIRHFSIYFHFHNLLGGKVFLVKEKCFYQKNISIWQVFFLNFFCDIEKGVKCKIMSLGAPVCVWAHVSASVLCAHMYACVGRSMCSIASLLVDLVIFITCSFFKLILLSDLRKQNLNRKTVQVLRRICTKYICGMREGMLKCS